MYTHTEYACVRPHAVRACTHTLTRAIWHAHVIEAADLLKPMLLFSQVRRVFLRLPKDDTLPLVVCKTAFSSCAHVYPRVSASTLPASLVPASCWARVACLLQTNPCRLCLRVNIGKENRKRSDGFCSGFWGKNSYVELENPCVPYHTRKSNMTRVSNLSLMEGFVDLQEPLAWSWFWFYRWGSCSRERWIHWPKVTQQVNGNSRNKIQIVWVLVHSSIAQCKKCSG